jgi:hypothetical protein
VRVNRVDDASLGRFIRDDLCRGQPFNEQREPTVGGVEGAEVVEQILGRPVATEGEHMLANALA